MPRRSWTEIGFLWGRQCQGVLLFQNGFTAESRRTQRKKFFIRIPERGILIKVFASQEPDQSKCRG